jgi:hypothetical protein
MEGQREGSGEVGGRRTLRCLNGKSKSLTIKSVPKAKAPNHSSRTTDCAFDPLTRPGAVASSSSTAERGRILRELTGLKKLSQDLKGRFSLSLSLSLSLSFVTTYVARVCAYAYRYRALALDLGFPRKKLRIIKRSR